MCLTRNRRRALRVGALLSVAILGCVPPSGPTRVERYRIDMNQISRAEIEAQLGRFGTAYDMIRALRPNMLKSRAVAARSESRSSVWQTSSGIEVYLDGIACEGVGSLATIPAATVQEVRWLSSVDATTRYGGRNTAGAIVVTTQNGRR
jgi:hypothetical protein